MNENTRSPVMRSTSPPPPDSNLPVIRIASIALVGCMLLTVLVVVRSGKTSPPAAQTATFSASSPMTVTHSGRGFERSGRRDESSPAPARPAEEVVAEKISQFARSHEDLVAAMAQHYHVAVPPDVSRFFAAVQAGDWPMTTNLFTAIIQLRGTTNWPPGLEKLWPAIKETYGVAEQAHLWPAQQLLDYGNAVLDSLRPGMIYLAGTDEGLFIPALLTDASGGEPHVVLTQNGLADNTYLDYVRFRYSDKLNALSAEDSQNSFQNYMADAQKRLQHDQDFPNEPKQVRPGEDIRMADGRFQAGGQIAVMAINEQLLRTLLQKNPDLSFALQESFPLQSFHGEATTLGPITELRAADSTSALTPERAAQTLDYWHSTTQKLLADADTAGAAREAYARSILAQGGLFQDRQLPGEAEQAYQLALSLNPSYAPGVFKYLELLTQQKRFDEARQIAQTAVNIAPHNEQFRQVLAQLSKMK